jgi:hypothetical protein
MAKPHLHLVPPATVKRTVTLRRLSNSDIRTREYLTEAEVEKLMDAAKGNALPTVLLSAFQPTHWPLGPR